MTRGVALLAHPRIAHVAGALHRHAPVVADTTDVVGIRRAAVLVMLRLAESNDLEILLIKRAEFPDDPWSGHVALPGGREEPGDQTLERTAVRETFEETAIDIAQDGLVLGTLDDVRPRSHVIPSIVVRPFVAVVRADVALTLSDEVAAAFWVGLETLRHPGAAVEATVLTRGDEFVVPSFRLGEHTVWGLTERILRNFLAVCA